jgi:hypothetical protein
MKTHPHLHHQTSWIIMVPTKHSLLPSLIIDVFNFKILFLGENTLWGRQDCYRIVLFFKGTMFEFQPCQYYERFSQCFCIYGKSKPKNWNATKVTFLFMSYTFEGQFYALMIRFENTIIFYVNPTTFFTFLASLKFLVFRKLFLISCVFWKKKNLKKHVLIEALTQNLTLKLFVFHYI